MLFTGYIRLLHPNPRIMIRSSNRVIFEMRPGGAVRVIKIDHPIALLFLAQAPPVQGTTLLPYFPMLQFTGNESNTIKYGMCRESCFIREWSSKFALVFYTILSLRTRTRMKLSVGISESTRGNTLALLTQEQREAKENEGSPR